MIKTDISFTGRKMGAIGKFYSITISVTAPEALLDTDDVIEEAHRQGYEVNVIERYNLTKVEDPE